MIQKIKTIIFSRFKKPNEESYVKVRREACMSCPFNTINKEKVILKVKIIKFFSDLYSKITNNKKIDNLGLCGICGCSIYYKTLEKSETCPAKPKKW